MTRVESLADAEASACGVQLFLVQREQRKDGGKIREGKRAVAAGPRYRPVDRERRAIEPLVDTQSRKLIHTSKPAAS